jgi:hypothetical protein
MKKIIIIYFLIFSNYCFAQLDYELIPKLLAKDSTHFFDKYLQNVSKYRIQIIYTQINRDSLNKPSFVDYFYRIEENEYFYPASIVKLPFAVFALEKLQEKSIDINTKFCYQKDSTVFKYDSLFKFNKCYSIAQLINRALVVSDNQAANNLYEIASPSYIDFRMKSLGLQQSRITQRFAKTDTILSRRTKPFFLFDATGTSIFNQDELHWNYKNFSHLHQFTLGKGQYFQGKTILKPYDFTFDNYISLPEIHDFLKTIMLKDSSENGLFISPKNLVFLRTQLSMYPKECKLNSFKTSDGYHDACRKYLMFGTENQNIDTNIRVFNKVGLAYGFATDIAYIVDYKEKIEFMLSAVIYANEDEILNDGKYEYETIAFPFMKQLGKTFYEYEKNRIKKHLPKLNKMEY